MAHILLLTHPQNTTKTTTTTTTTTTFSPTHPPTHRHPPPPPTPDPDDPGVESLPAQGQCLDVSDAVLGGNGKHMHFDPAKLEGAWRGVA